MNMQALMKQAQTMQREITKTKEEIDKMEFVSENSLVRVKTNGKKEILEIKFLENIVEMEKEDTILLEDMILVAINDAFNKVDKMTEQKMGKYTSMMNGLM